MAISKQQPMRPALDDCIDFLNDNLEIGDIEVGITNLQHRVTTLENERHVKVLTKSVEEMNQLIHHLLVPVELPEGVSADDVLCCLVDGGVFKEDVVDSAITALPLCYTRFINWFYDDETHSIVFHWYPSATTASTTKVLTYVYTGIVVYLERN